MGLLFQRLNIYPLFLAENVECNSGHNILSYVIFVGIKKKKKESKLNVTINFEMIPKKKKNSGIFIEYKRHRVKQYVSRRHHLYVDIR